MSKKITLNALTFRPTLAGPEVTQDLHREIAEAIYQNAATLAQHSFALRLYESDGTVEATCLLYTSMLSEAATSR